MALNWDRETSVGALGAMKSHRVPRFRAICTRSLVNCRFEPHAKITRLGPDARSAASPTRQVPPLSPSSATSRLPAAGTGVATCVPFISVAERGSQKPAIGAQHRFWRASVFAAVRAMPASAIFGARALRVASSSAMPLIAGLSSPFGEGAAFRGSKGPATSVPSSAKLLWRDASVASAEIPLQHPNTLSSAFSPPRTC
ncbi:hypothetical protein HETIRDRAFT_455906 [Heterobasidion irregulare TC 32-1]|uniref:Uncharacterized protein n=1 Tax=Heterobasidion irregulare (strain TC 32-1) TaxID=747525 RepID=W4JP35_HETIT|nr:uncharacterized protein HETIRDRAFT_455906 [Heterobasidion irregulare TC 32-1]ETW75254.1 hypothetical protein HETIRDRAFT_455906 [Heterobasidion irregulare TC 32-1]